MHIYSILIMTFLNVMHAAGLDNSERKHSPRQPLDMEEYLAQGPPV